MVGPILNLNSMGISLIVITMDIEHMSIDKKHQLHLDLKVIFMHVRTMVTRHKIVDLMRNIVRHLKTKEMHLGKLML